MLTEKEVSAHIDVALEQREGWFDDRHITAFRLFNGFIEGFPELAIDIYARTLVLFNFHNPPDPIQDLIQAVTNHLCDVLPWLQAVIVKTRYTNDVTARHGLLVRGDQPDRRVREHEVWYAIDLQMSSDASLYLDTRELRAWIIQHTNGKRVLNTFAYTGSLGVAATVGGASHVIHLDRNRKSLNLAKASYSLNGLAVRKSDFVSEDFFTLTSRMRRTEQRFDMVFLDPPFFSLTPGGRVDLNQEYNRLVNKVRPLIDDGGTLVAINNALFVSGSDFIHQLEELSQDGYMKIEELILIPADFSGFPETRQGSFPTDPIPFNHPTKIAVLKVKKTKIK